MKKVDAKVPQGNDKENQEKKDTVQGCVGIITILCAIAAIAYSVYVLSTI